MSDFARKLKIRGLDVSSERFSPDDYEFTLGGKTYYMDAKCRCDKSFLTVAVLDELELDKKKKTTIIIRKGGENHGSKTQSYSFRHRNRLARKKHGY